MKIMFNEVRNNKIKSLFLMFVFILVIGVLGAIIGIFYGNLYFGISIAVIFSLIYSMIGFYSGSRMILKMSGAKPVTKKNTLTYIIQLKALLYLPEYLHRKLML